MGIDKPQHDWQPTASIESLRLRANVLAKIRQFFAERGILEVETPLLCRTTATDPYITSFKIPENYFLQTSPEFPMKRLLAANSGPIYQICKAFRNDEMGRLHNPEFTILEWYRPQFNHHDLMTEMDEFLQTILQTTNAERLTYAEVFSQYLQINPHNISLVKLQDLAKQHNINVNLEKMDLNDRNNWLDLLFTHVIEAKLGRERPLFIYHYPASRAALARISATNSQVAERFEVYVQGMELANGYHELADATEQRKRFIADQQTREELGYDRVPVDERLLAALENGFPACAGVALGIDRLVMLATKAQAIKEIISFPWNHV